MAWVYILESLDDGRYYIGSTADIEQRLRHHMCGATPSTSRMGTLKEVFRQEFEDLPTARKIEKRLKNLKRKDYIKRVVEDGYLR
ncbi:MAG TPA: GIY-YIG nuclease family protein, partial [Candidatus Paceibacterota bacterium]